jgi:hypothetical protein
MLQPAAPAQHIPERCADLRGKGELCVTIEGRRGRQGVRQPLSRQLISQRVLNPGYMGSSHTHASLYLHHTEDAHDHASSTTVSGSALPDA